MSEVQAAVEEEDFVDVELESSDNETAAPKEEKKPKVEPEVDLEIVDDTPEEDRNRTPSEKPADPTEEELKNYSKQANERIRHFTKGYHDERRAKEQALREREEAIEYAKSLQDQNKTLRFYR